MYTHVKKHTKKYLSLLSIFALVAAALVARPMLAQVAQDQPIKGTIEVTEGDDYQTLARISADEARAAAAAEFPGAAVSENELDEEDGFLVYDLELTHEGQEIEVVVDAGNGSILEVEREEDDNDDDDDGDDDDGDDDDGDND